MPFYLLFKTDQVNENEKTNTKNIRTQLPSQQRLNCNGLSAENVVDDRSSWPLKLKLCSVTPEVPLQHHHINDSSFFHFPALLHAYTLHWLNYTSQYTTCMYLMLLINSEKEEKASNFCWKLTSSIHLELFHAERVVWLCNKDK